MRPCKLVLTFLYTDFQSHCTLVIFIGFFMVLMLCGLLYTGCYGQCAQF